jgi:glycerophosphoryl diester phosphodiesterase
MPIPCPKPWVVAHRGSAQTAPENTIAAFEAAIALGADMIEFDVRTTTDRKLVVCHDPKVDGRPIAQLLWSELRAINPAIPSLEETLQCCKDRIWLDVELKEIGQEMDAIALLLEHLMRDQFVVTSFHLESLRVTRRTDPEIAIGLLLKRSWRDRLWNHQILDRHAQIIDLQPDFLAPQVQLLGTSWLEQVNVLELPYWVWTVNDADRLSALSKNQQVHAIVTDDVALGLQMRALAQ